MVAEAMTAKCAVATAELVAVAAALDFFGSGGSFGCATARVAVAAEVLRADG